jgi:hypothetical protein
MNLRLTMRLFAEKLFNEARGRNPALVDDETTRWRYRTGADSLRKLAVKLHQSYVDGCNRPQTERELMWEAENESRITALVAELGLKGVELNGDPRGLPIKIQVEHVNGDDFGGGPLLCVPSCAASAYRGKQ